MSLSSDDNITLDMRTFKALASNTRVDILKALEQKQKTVSELARELNMNKATLFQHLEQLYQVGLVKRLDGEERLKTVKRGPHEAPQPGPPRKWVYYKLTWRGKNIVNPQRKVKFAIMISLFAAIGILSVMFIVANTILFTPSSGPGEMKDTGTPQFDMWDTPSPNTAMTDYTFHLEIYDDQTTKKVTGLDPASVSIEYAIGSREEMATPDILGWKSVSHTHSGDVYTATITGVDWAVMGGKYLHIQVTATDKGGVRSDTVRVLYIVQFTEPDLIFGDNGKFGGSNGLFGDKGVYVTGGGGGSGGYVFGVQVTNIGDSDSESFKVGIYTMNPDTDGDGHLDSDPDIEDHTVTTFKVPAIEAGETENITRDVSLTIIYNVRAPETGDDIYFMIDPGNAVKEREEGNNVQRADAPKDLINVLGKENEPKKSEAMDGGAAPGFDGILAAAAIGTALVAIAVRQGRRTKGR